MRILQVNSSARRTGSQSSQLAGRIVGQLRAANPGATLTLRDLARDPHPVLDEAALQALFTPEAERTREQAARAAPRHARRHGGALPPDVLGFLGMKGVRFFYAEGLAMGPEAAERAFENARSEIEAALG